MLGYIHTGLYKEKSFASAASRGKQADCLKKFKLRNGWLLYPFAIWETIAYNKYVVKKGSEANQINKEINKLYNGNLYHDDMNNVWEFIVAELMGR